MVTLSKSELNRIVGQSYRNVNFSQKLNQSATGEKQGIQRYDIFLSHSYLDRETVLQLNYFLEEKLNLKVFVDWIEQPELDRSQVTLESAAILRDAMNRSASLMYAVSANSASSKWMPWELGYSDAKHNRVAVLPIADQSSTLQAYQNQEFVGLYPYIEISSSSNGDFLWVNNRGKSKAFANLPVWIIDGKFPHTF